MTPNARSEEFVRELLSTPAAQAAYNTDAMFHTTVNAVLYGDPAVSPLVLLGRLLAEGLVAERRSMDAWKLEQLRLSTGPVRKIW